MKTKNIIATLVAIALMIVPQVAFAIPAPTKITDPSGQSIVPEFDELVDSAGEGTGGLVGYFIDQLLFLLGIIAVVFLIVAGYRLVIARGEEEALGKAKQSIMYAVAGLVIVAFARIITNIFFEYGRGGTPGTEEETLNAALAESTVQAIIQFGEVLLGVVAVLFIIIAGYQYITARGEEEHLTKAKHSIMYAVGGLMTVVLAETLVRIFYNYEAGSQVPTADLGLGLATVVSITNFALAFVGVIAVLMLIIAGFQYLTARGEEGQIEKAKQTLLYAAIGLVVIVFAYVIVSIVVSGNVG